MNETQHIGQLIEPNPISFSFGAPGWYILLALVVLIFAIIALIFFLRHKKRKYRRQAIQQLQEMNESELSSTLFLSKTMSTIKQVAITTYGRDNLVAIKGIDFINLLKKRNKNKAIYSEEIEKLFYNGLYQNQDLSPSIKAKTIEESINWINQHHV